MLHSRQWKNIVVVLLVKPLGGYMTRVFTGGKTFLDPVLVPIERFIYKVTGINASRQMSAKHYTIAFLLFSLVGTLLLYALAIPALALAKLFALQPQRAATAGTLPTDTFLFSTVVVGTAIIVVALTYLPAVAPGPVVEHLRMPGH